MNEERPMAPVEFRAATVAGVNYAQRIIEVVAVPYDLPSMIEWRGELWEERFRRGAFDGIEKRPGRVKANRDHDMHRLVGKAVKFWPSRDEGLVSELRISQTPLGDETLALADDGVLDPSIGFAALGRDQILDRRAMTREHTKAFLDHISLVPDPAYKGAKVVAVRDASTPDEAALPRLVTPVLDEFRSDEFLQQIAAKFRQ